MNFQDVLSRVEAFTTSLIEQSRATADPTRAERLLRHHLHQLLLQSGEIAEAVGEPFCTEDVSVHLFDAPSVVRGRAAVAEYWSAQRGVRGVLLFDELRGAADDWGVLTEQVNRHWHARTGGAMLISCPVSTVNVFGAQGRIEEIRIYPAKRSEQIELPLTEVPDPRAVATSLAPAIARIRELLR